MLDAGDEYLLKALGIIGGGARPGSGDIAGRIILMIDDALTMILKKKHK